MILNFSKSAKENIPDVAIFKKESFPKNCEQLVLDLEKRGRIDFSKNKFSVLEMSDKTIITATMKENFPINNVCEVKDFFGGLIHFCKNENITEFNLLADNLDKEMLYCLSECVRLGEYGFKKGKFEEVSMNVNVVSDKLTETEISSMKKGKIFGDILCDVRDMVNKTSDIMTPVKFVEETKELFNNSDIEIEILRKDQLEKLSFKALLSVSQGAKQEPAAVIMRYKGDAENPNNITALLGKGITFDSGGLSLKSKSGMITMHHDMAGAAAVVGAMRMIACEKPKKNVVAMAVLCENMLSEYAYRPGDIIDTMNGKTVLINSTDAEGRLILADGLTYLLEKENAKRIVDIATLTGGVVSALGNRITGYASNDDSMSNSLNEAGNVVGEPVWRMPLVESYREKLKPVQADLANSTLGDGPAMITGALFLSEFVGETPWIHIDFAGTAWTSKEYGRYSYGATAVGSEMMANLVERI